jgi:hypothetical protein
MTTNSTTPTRLQKSLPSSYYQSEEIFAREKEKIFYREWFCAAREEQLQKPGDYLVLDVAGESILLVRTKDIEVKAHYNVAAIGERDWYLGPGKSKRAESGSVAEYWLPAGFVVGIISGATV